MTTLFYWIWHFIRRHGKKICINYGSRAPGNEGDGSIYAYRIRFCPLYVFDDDYSPNKNLRLFGYWWSLHPEGWHEFMLWLGPWWAMNTQEHWLILHNKEFRIFWRKVRYGIRYPRYGLWKLRRWIFTLND
jgi:hypothetical protein